jgi:hypothetical protein
MSRATVFLTVPFALIMTPDHQPSLIRAFEWHLRAENRSEHAIASYYGGGQGV